MVQNYVAPQNPEGTWEEFRYNRERYQSVRELTKTDQGGLCAYCERLLPENDQQVAHFHPKSDKGGCVNWGLHWPNLWFACCGGERSYLQDLGAYLPPVVENRSCDVMKEDSIVDDHVLSPAEIPAFPAIFRYEQFPDQIHIIADEESCQQAGISWEKAKNTVCTFNLNCLRLAQARMHVHKSAAAAIKRIRKHSAEPLTHYHSLARHHLQKPRWEI